MEKLNEFLRSSPDLQLRAFSSVFIVLAVVGGIMLGGHVWSAIVILIAMFSLWEFHKLQLSRLSASPVLIMISGLFILLGTAFGLMSICLLYTSSNKNTGVDEVREIIKRHGGYLRSSEEGKRRRWSQLEMEVEAILRGEISQLVENAWKERKSDEVMEDLSSRRANPYTLAGEIMHKVVK